MSSVVVSPLLLSAWTVVWIRLPRLTMLPTVAVVAVAAMRRARTDDVPAIFRTFVTAAGRTQEFLPDERSGTRVVRPVQDEEVVR